MLLFIGASRRAHALADFGHSREGLVDAGQQSDHRRIEAVGGQHRDGLRKHPPKRRHDRPERVDFHLVQGEPSARERPPGASRSRIARKCSSVSRLPAPLRAGWNRSATTTS
jgi:hypothetical protein